jgi:hypothetical protein
MNRIVFFVASLLVCVHVNAQSRAFNPQLDFISLHDDFAADPDDGQSVAADRTVLQTIYGKSWMRVHSVPVSGTCGTNCNIFVPSSSTIMNAVWHDRWLSAYYDKLPTIRKLVKIWIKTIQSGGDVWIKEGGQSDITAEVVRRIRTKTRIRTEKRIHLIQHGLWNETHTTPGALAYVQTYTDYVKIQDQNQFFQRFGGDPVFVNSAIHNSIFGRIWRAAFAWLPPSDKIDFSDTGELIYILGLKNLNIDTFRKRFLD